MKFDNLRLKSAVLISFVLASAYALLSGGNAYIKKSVLLESAFSFQKIQNFFSYMLVHTGLSHLFVNLVSGAAFALIIEGSLGFLDSIAIFLVSGVLTAVLFSFLNPNIVLIGASAGVSGLLGAAFFIDPKKALLGAVAVVAVTAFFIPSFVLFNVENAEQSIDSAISKAKEEHSIALVAGNIEKAEEIQETVLSFEEKKAFFKESQKFEIKTKTDFWIHGYGAFFGAMYVLLFRKNKIHKAISEIKWVEKFTRLKAEK